MHLAVAPRRELIFSSMCRVCHTRLFNALDQFGRSKLVSSSFPSSDDRVDRLDQFAQTQRYTPHGQGPDLILESVHRLLCGNGIEILPVQFGFDPIADQLKSAFAASDLKSEKLESLGDVHDPGSGRMASPYPMGDFHLLFLPAFLAHSESGHSLQKRDVCATSAFLPIAAV
jgi:hypothetical protein